jgi:acyl-CoA synthetase (NDP forming)
MAAGRETVLGMVRDPHLGPLLMFGLGGVLVETLRDVAFHPAPLTDKDAQEMIASIRGYPILAGVRGQKPVAFSALESALTRLSQLVMDFDCIQEVDINPFFASEFPDDCKAADVRIRLA